mgnify:CR=1 FL=1
MECWEIREFKNDLEILVSLIEKYKVPCEINVIHDLIGRFYEINNFEDVAIQAAVHNVTNAGDG